MLTQKEIIKQLKRENVDMGKNPARTFLFYLDKGLLPAPSGFRKKEPLYPANTPRIIREIRYAQQVEKRTVEEIKSAWESGEKLHKENFELLGLSSKPLNIYFKSANHGKYYSSSSDIIVAVYEHQIVLLLVEGLRGGDFNSLGGYKLAIDIIEKKTISMEAYGEFIRHQAMKRITGDGKILEEEYLLGMLFG